MLFVVPKEERVHHHHVQPRSPSSKFELEIFQTMEFLKKKIQRFDEMYYIKNWRVSNEGLLRTNACNPTFFLQYVFRIFLVRFSVQFYTFEIQLFDYFNSKTGQLVTLQHHKRLFYFSFFLSDSQSMKQN